MGKLSKSGYATAAESEKPGYLSRKFARIRQEQAAINAMFAAEASAQKGIDDAIRDEINRKLVTLPKKAAA